MTKRWVIPYSVLDLSPITEGHTASDALRNSLDLAQHVERWGYTRYWLAEHHNMIGIASSATAVVIGHIAGGTSTMRVGAGGIMLPNHAPLVVAEQFGTLDALYPGRIDLGLGRAPGTDQVTARALRRGPANNGEDFPDRVAELRAYLQRPEEGEHRPVRAVPGEGQDIPIWLLGSSDFSAQLAGQLGLPFGYASHFSPGFTLPALSLYRKSFQPSAALAAPYAMVGVNVIAADTDEEAAWLATSMQQMVLGLIRGRPGKLQPPVDSMDGLWTQQEQSILADRQRTTFIGSPTTVRAKLEQFLEDTRANEIIINTPIYHHPARLRSFELVAALFQS